MTYLEKIKELLPKVRTDIIIGYCPTIYFGLEICKHIHNCKPCECWNEEIGKAEE